MISVAIDGPVGAGKSTLARAAAKELGYIYMDTGALYRAVGLYAAERGAKPSDSGTVIPLLSGIRLELGYAEGVQRVLMNGRDVSEDIRKPEIGMAASDVSAIPRVREFLLDLQRDMAREQNVVMDGRDIGTVVLPDAGVKIFLTASEEVRARRRWEEHAAKGDDISYEEVLNALRIRDRNDSLRAIAPLKRADDAVLLDTTDLTFSESLESIIKIIKEHTR